MKTKSDFLKKADINNDGIVNEGDLNAMAALWLTQKAGKAEEYSNYENCYILSTSLIDSLIRAEF